MINKLKKIGIVAGNDFNNTALPQGLLDCLQRAAYKAQQNIVQEAKNFGTRKNGWNILYDIGSYGTDYIKRAVVAFIGMGANLPEDAVYPTAFVDAQGNLLNGNNSYVLHFDKNQLPPVHAFWSVTLYNTRSFLVPNELDRYALGDRDKLAFNKDGSLDILIQNKNPGKDKESNWLPAPKTTFNITMRLYWPKKSVLNMTWNPLGIQKIK